MTRTTDTYTLLMLFPLTAVLAVAQGAPSDETAPSGQTVPVDQGPPPDTAAPAGRPASADVIEMEKFEVNDVPLDEQILPTVRPIGSVLGDDRNIIDTPRSVSSVNKAWMDERRVTNAMDFGQFSPGVYSSAQYGVPATPQIRGDLGELYINGQRIKYSRNSVLPSFNGVEAMDIIKGPGSAVYGPQGQGPGGYVNLVSKAPYFDAQHTTLTTTLGYWTSGRSYFNPEVQLDTGGPLGDKLAYRVSYLSRYGDGYYLNTDNETQDIYAALTWKPTDRLTIDWWGQYYKNDFNEIAGMNRVTQDLIDNGNYIAGPVTGGPWFGVLEGANAHTVKLHPWQALVSPDDYNESRRFQTQLIATADLGDDSKLVNRSYYEDRTSEKVSGYGYTEYVPTDYSFSNRTEWHTPGFTLFGTENKAITGVEFRYERLVSFQDFSQEPFFYYDLTQDPDTWAYPFTPPTGGGTPVPGHEKFGYNPWAGNGTQDSIIRDLAVFYQQDTRYTDELSSVLGIRLDHIWAAANSPKVIPSTDGAYYRSSGDEDNISYFASLIYKLTPNSSVYVTYNQVNAITGSANFGGVDGSAGDERLSDSLQAESVLYEAGYKTSLFNNTLYLSAAVFKQTRMRPQLVGPAARIRDYGLELEAVYQPNRKLTVNANLTWQDARQYGSGFYQQTGDYRDGYAPDIIVDGQPGTGVGSPNYATYVSPKGFIEAPGVPSVMANLFVQYEFDNHFGFGIGPQFQSRMNANAQGTLHIPNQVQVNGYVFYRGSKRWDVQVNVNNLLNDDLYDPIDVGFAGNDVVYHRPGLSTSITFRIHL
ncbi:outer membrane receptor protein [Opitutaceae bacterium TAV1]|nr:outer membrane receptor protein [Opitutaceae bacterium TAV1]